VSLVYETILSSLGSRFSYNFLPRLKKIKISPLGRFYDVPVDFSLGIKFGENVRILPFSDQYPSFYFVEQEITPLGVTFYFREPQYGLNGRIEFCSPFYPEDEKISTAPFFYINAFIEYTGEVAMVGDDHRDISNRENFEGELFLEIQSDCFIENKVSSTAFYQKMRVSIDEKEAQDKWLYRTKGKDFSGDVYEGWLAFSSYEKATRISQNRISIPFVSRLNKETNLQLISGGYTIDKIMQIEDSFYKFKYTDFFDSLEEVLLYAHVSETEIRKKSTFFEHIFTNSHLNKAELNFIAFSFQSYLSNTWWVINDNKKEWFTVWEGNCAYHSTIDVEYNTGLFYFMLWPKLMEMTIRQWVSYEKKPGYMSHDIGKFLVGKGMEYSHDMEVEENCDFILLNFALYKLSGITSVVEELYPLLKRLMLYVYACDTTGNGFPDTGTANTVDDANPAIQFAKEQTYLGIKSLSAYRAMHEIATKMNDNELAFLCERTVNTINNTLDSEAWLEDHYAVCLTKEMSGIKDAWTGKELKGKLEGWDAYSIYSSNGLLYLLMTGTELLINKDKIKKDIVNSTQYSMTKYGCKHSSKEASGKLWISQNIWKDMIASYLGIDMSEYMTRYWDYEIYENTQGKGGCFVDSPPYANLNYYPRGIASLGILYAAAGLSVDQLNKKIKLAPSKIPCKIPLLSLIDWKDKTVPFVECTLKEGIVDYQLLNMEQLIREDYEIYIFNQKYNP